MTCIFMQCKHPVRKYKLVSWATDDRYGHEQGFLVRVCCALCGCIVYKNKKPCFSATEFTEWYLKTHEERRK